jgi:hypothetical protein
MGRRGGVKIKKLKVNTANSDDVKELHKMFGQITGTDDADPEIIIPKINKIYKNIQEYKKLYSVLLNFKTFIEQFSDFKIWFSDIEKFLKELLSTTNTDMKTKYGEEELDYHKMSKEELNVFYKGLKDNKQIKQMVITGSNLALYKKYLEDTTTTTVNDTFIFKEPGLTLQPLAFSGLDLKIIWNTDGFTETAKKFIMTILRRTYVTGIDMYDIITSPDVDIKKFSKILVDSIANMKKQIPRCDKAFAIIEKSVEMLETNFKTYFRGSVEAGNPNIIIESFIMDISTTQKAGASVAGEFRKIVSFLREKGAGNNDPKVKKLFSMLNNQFSSLDSELGVKPSEPEVKDETV